MASIALFFGMHAIQDLILSDHCAYRKGDISQHLTALSQLQMLYTSRMQEFVLKTDIHAPNACLYVMLVLSTILFIFVFKRNIQGRKSNTTKYKQDHKLNDASLVQCVLALCLVHRGLEQLKECPLSSLYD